jgi:hypothetical protein
MEPNLEPTGRSRQRDSVPPSARRSTAMSLPEPQGHVPPDLGSGWELRIIIMIIMIVDALHYCFSSHRGSGATPSPPALHRNVRRPPTSVPSPAPRPRRLSSPEASGSEIRKGYRRVRRQTQRAPRPSKIVFSGFWGVLLGERRARILLPQEVPRQETVGEQKANTVKSARYGPTPRQPRSGDAEQGEPQGTPTDSREF